MYAAGLGMGKTMNTAFDGRGNLEGDPIAGLTTGIAWLEQAARFPEGLSETRGEAGR